MWTLYQGDCREIMAGLEDSSVDAVVTDPPYDLTANKKGGSGPKSVDLRSPAGRSRIGTGFMGMVWDATGIAFQPDLWREVLRVLKPGGHLLAFGGTRTYHRMAIAIEDAGFEIRDSIHWIYGSGFPKSLDVSKAIDKAAGARGHEGRNMRTDDGTGTASYRPTIDPRDYVRPPPATDDARTWLGWGTALKPSHEPVVVARKPLDGTVAANVLAHGTGALNIDGCRVGNEPRINPPAANKPGGTSLHLSVRGMPADAQPTAAAGRWPSNVIFSHLPECGDTCAEGCAVAELDGQSGESKSVASGYNFESSKNDNPTRLTHNIKSGVHYGDTGGASRFFPAFRYQAKPSKSERDQGLSGFMVQRAGGMTATVNGSMKTGSGNDRKTIRANVHPTVKPVELMRWLVRLVTPPGGVVLDPFTGSGTTGVACMLEGFPFIGIEREPEYMQIAAARIAHAKDKKQATDS